MNTCKFLFWLSLCIVFYTYAGYGILLFFLVKLKALLAKAKPVVPSDFFPPVTLLIAAYNEEDIIEVKMNNTNNLVYPSEKLKIAWVTDGSTDTTNIKLSNHSNVKVLYMPERAGKTAALNRAVPLLDTPFIVFTDANTMLNEKAIINILSPFVNQNVGCVAGEKRIEDTNKSNASAGGEGLYWKYESFLKQLDSKLYSAVGAAGELFAIRKELFEQMSPDTLLDDFILSMTIASKGYKIEYCKDAYAVEQGSLNMSEEKKRKVRIAAGGIQAVLRLKGLLNIIKHPVLSFQYISHRVLRWTITPFLLFLLLPLNLCLSIFDPSSLYDFALLMQILFYVAALPGIVSKDRKIKNKVLFVAYYFFFMNWNVLLGIRYLFNKKRGDGTWEKSRRI